MARDPDGTLRLRGEPLAPHSATLLALLDDAARRAPDRRFLVERDERDALRTITFAQLAQRSRGVGAGLLALGASASRPLLILAPNGIDHALAAFGAMRAGIPAVPIAPVLALSADDGFARLRAIVALVRPGAVFASDGTRFAAARAAVAPDLPYVCGAAPPAGAGAIDLRRLAAFDRRGCDDVSPGAETIAKIMFTSGSSGEPKAVVVTHAMLAAMLQGIAQRWPFLDREPPVVVDWLPWSHCFGGNKVLGIVLRHAGTLHVDAGAPTPDRYQRTVRLRRQIAPTIAFDVPLGWTRWVERLRADDGLRRHWLSRLQLACWGGATLAPATRDALRSIGVPLAAGWGATETGPAISLSTGTDPPPDALGIPLPGVELKLVPLADGGEYEARVRAAQVTPGYYWQPALTAAAFDGEGYYRTGDVVRALDDAAPQRGLAFVGRLDDRFKLSSGAWVRADELRRAFLAACPDVEDALVTGESADEAGVLAWPRAVDALEPSLLVRQIRDALRSVRIEGGTSGRLSRALVLADPPAGAERSDKGTLVRAEIVARRARSIARLHASEPDDEVIVR